MYDRCVKLTIFRLFYNIGSVLYLIPKQKDQ